jgi:uncharacterized protein YecT (DUF1311 family)
VRSLSLCAALMLGASDASAFDCTKAATAIEKAICANADLMRQDAALAQAYGAARAAVLGEQRKALALSQKRWIETRENICGNLEGAELARCVDDETRKRLSLLNAAPESGPGYPEKMVPVFLERKGVGVIYELDYALLQFAMPRTLAERQLNGEVAKILAEAPRASADFAAPEGMTLSQTAWFTLSYASSRMISISHAFYSFDGGAHGNGGVTNVNLDMETGGMIRTGDLFTGAALQDLTEKCKQQIIAEKISRNRDDPQYDIKSDANFHEDTVAAGVSQFSRWTILEDKAVVTFDAYAVGSYAEGAYECSLPMAEVKALARTPNPLPGGPP